METLCVVFRKLPHECTITLIIFTIMIYIIIYDNELYKTDRILILTTFYNNPNDFIFISHTCNKKQVIHVRSPQKII